MDAKPFLYLAIADQTVCARLREALLADFELNCFGSVAEVKAAFAQRLPDALLLDTSLSDADAYALHRELRDDFDAGDVPQLLMCSEEEAGRSDFVADAFLLRPCADSIVLRSLSLLRQRLEKQQAAREQMSYAQNVAMTAMSSMGDLGVVMEFMTKSFACRSIQSVGALALQVITQYELESVVHFVWEGESYTARSDGQDITDVERELLAQVRPLGRLLELNGQLIVNFEHTTILIRQLPDDPVRCGRIRDNIATLCEGLESRVVGLLLEHDNLLKQQGIRYAVCEIRDSVNNLYERQLADLRNSRELISDVIDHFEEAFVHLALPAEVENQMVGLLVDMRREIGDIWSQPSEVEERLKRVIASLETLAGEVGADSPEDD